MASWHAEVCPILQDCVLGPISLRHFNAMSTMQGKATGGTLATAKLPTTTYSILGM